MSAPCRHVRLEIISQDESGKFVECLDCREIFESGELDEMEQRTKDAAEHTENLSDA